MIYTVTLNPAVDRQLSVAAMEPNVVLRATASRTDCGGKGFNVSRMVAALGGESVALGFAGGHSGRWLRDELANSDIATDFVWVEDETRTNTSIVVDGGGYFKVNEAGAGVSAENIHSLLAQVKRLAHTGDYWVLAGSLPPSTPTSIYADLTTIIQNAGAYVLLDASSEALRLGCTAQPFLIKPNQFEAAQVTGQDDPLSAGKALLGSGVENVVMSLGADGTLLFDDNGTFRVSTPQIVERNPIGAGDSLVGGVVWALQQGKDVAEAVRWGNACGAAAASLDGTAFGSREMVEDLLAQIVVEEY